MIQANTVITGDSLTVLRSMDNESVDMVITDPPYGIDYQSGRKGKSKPPRKNRQRQGPVHLVDLRRRQSRETGGYSVLPAGTFSRYSSTRCGSPA